MSDPREPVEEIEELEPDAEEGAEEELVAEEPADGEGDEEPALEADSDEPAPAQRPRKKGAADTIRELRKAKQDAELRAARAEGAASARASQPDPAAALRQAQDEAEERRLVEAMRPEERIQYQLAKETRQTQQTVQQMRAEMANSRDEGRFLAKYGNDARFRDYLDDVEKRHGEMLRAGVPIEREAVLKFLIGERAMSAPAKKAGTVQRRAGAERVAAARGGNTGAARSNTRGAPQRGGSLVSRMEAADAPI